MDSTQKYGVVDLFSGPGGLAEGFSAVKNDLGEQIFEIEVSIEKDPSAHSTLVLRSFLRKHDKEYPAEYYEFLNGNIPEPDWERVNQTAWKRANDDTCCMALGSEEARELLESRIPSIRKKYSDRTVLIGGPPCQAYSLAGRSRNAGRADYVPHEDERNYLYKEYVEVIRLLEPSIFVMENVKGMLSSAIKGDRLFMKVMADLRNSARPNGYLLVPLAVEAEFSEGPKPSDFVVRSENYGIPQARHRVIIVGIRNDLARNLTSEMLPLLKSVISPANVMNVLGDLPPLRSGLSRGDSYEAWADVVKGYAEFLQSRSNWQDLSDSEYRKAEELLRDCIEFNACEPTIPRKSTGGASVPDACPKGLRCWLEDGNLDGLPNHDTRGHMQEDLGRYLFASVFGAVKGRSPKAPNYPSLLAPAHKNWLSGKFSDRFRVQLAHFPATTITCHISKDGHYYIHPDPKQCRSLTVREAARLQTFPDNYYFKGNRTQQYVQVGNAVPPYLAYQIAQSVRRLLEQLFADGLAEDTAPNAAEVF